MKLITGMHRSGTSLVTRIFYEMGADLGSEETFYRPDKWNPEGYYEQPDIHRINMPLINGIFWKFAYFRLPSTETILRRAQKMSKLIKKTYKKYNEKLVKETRFCLTLPAWLEQGAEFEKIIICLRHPLEIASSIHRRNKIWFNHGFYLFNEHYERILQHTSKADIDVWFIDYNTIIYSDLDEVVEEVGGALRFMEIDFVREELQKILSEIIREPLSKRKSIDHDIPKETQILWNRLKESHQFQTKTK